MKLYINTKTSQGIETLEEVDSSDFETNKDFYNEVKQVVNSYIKAFHGSYVYSSIRPTNEYKNR